MQLGGDSKMTETRENLRIRILALDDDQEREVTKYKPMEDGTLEVKFVNLKDQNTIEIINNLEIEPTDIIFVDHRLDKTSADSAAFMPTGKSATPLLRNKWPKAPIFGVTAAKDACIKHDGNTFYEDIFALSDISLLQDYIPYVVDGYQKLRAVIPTQGEVGFVELLKAPEDEIASILHSIPDELRRLDADSFSHALYRWFRRTLHGHAGFLYDKKWAAITLGINPDHFDEYAATFGSAKYAGIWSDPNEPRWWKKKLYELAIEERKSPREPVQSAACKRFNVPAEHYCHCFKCGKIWPEILAFTDDGPLEDLVPAHLECSKPHPKRFVSLSFEEPRIIVE